MAIDLIHGQRWHEIADVIYDGGVDPITRQPKKFMSNLQFINERPCVIFCRLDFLDAIFSLVRNSQFNHTLITNNSDFPITASLFDSKPTNIIAWYAQNVSCIRNGLIPIPIGLERPYGGGISANYNAVLSNMGKQKNKLVYMNHNDANNTLIRTPITQTFINCGWVTHERNVSFDIYMRNMSEHKFVFSPNGNGLDCHRTWEALYVGTIPIVNRNPVTEYMARFLPIMIVDDMTMITEDLLYKYYDDISKSLYNMNVLAFSWWKNTILNRTGII